MAIESSSSRNVIDNTDDFILISNRSDVLDFVKNAVGYNTMLKTQTQIVEVAFATSTFVFLDVSSINAANMELALKVIRYYFYKIMLIVPFDHDRQLLLPIFSFCQNIIPFPSDLYKASAYIYDALSKRKMEKDSNFPSYLPEDFEKYPELAGIIGESPKTVEIKNKIISCARNNSPVLILGETGTGKSTIAKIIHNLSERKDRTFSQLNISTVSETLADSTLFGTLSGAYTDAKKRDGILKTSDKGTVFIDEIGTAPLNVQTKLFVFMDTGEYYSLGSDKAQKADVRLIFATNDNLKLKIMQGEFRKDLLFRMSGEVIYLSPLRDRRGDISIIANKFAEEHGKTISDAALAKLESYFWPGNIRQLKFCIERACHRGNSQIDLQDLEWYN